MRNRIRTYSFLLFGILFFFTQSFASNRDTLIHLSAQVIQEQDGSPIPLAHILIKHKRKGTMADSTGYFSLEVAALDTLLISALGFRTEEWTVPLTFSDEFRNFYRIPLSEISYMLTEVDVFALGTWEEFKEEFVKLKLPESKYKINESIITELKPYSRKPPSEIPPMYRNVFREKPNLWDAIGTPTDFAYYHLSKKERSKRKVANMIRKEKKQKKIATKYNRELIARCTGLQGMELDRFTAFCNARLQVSEKSDEYEITAQIRKIYSEYKEQNPKEGAKTALQPTP